MAFCHFICIFALSKSGYMDYKDKTVAFGTLGWQTQFFRNFCNYCPFFIDKGFKRVDFKEKAD